MIDPHTPHSNLTDRVERKSDAVSFSPGPHALHAKNLIIGGGPAGLSAALHLEDADFLLAEKHSRTGGLCRSIVAGGFTFDHAGHI